MKTKEAVVVFRSEQLPSSARGGRRSDGTRDEWGEAVEAAAERQNERTVDYLLGIPTLSDYLEEGLDVFGISCADFDEGRM